MGMSVWGPQLNGWLVYSQAGGLLIFATSGRLELHGKRHDYSV